LRHAVNRYLTKCRKVEILISQARNDERKQSDRPSSRPNGSETHEAWALCYRLTIVRRLSPSLGFPRQRNNSRSMQSSSRRDEPILRRPSLPKLIEDERIKK
jgi:hypothetical protein